jgi:3-oxoacyl-ACP reductase-like protein
MKEIAALVASSPILQIVVGAFVLGITGLIVAIVVVIVKRGIKIGKIIEIRGMKEKKSPSVELALLPSTAKDESRTIVQEGAAAFCEYLTKLAGDLICGKEQAGCRHSQAEHEYALIIESLQHNLVGQIMQSVERNHYAELTDSEWIKIRDDLFRRIFFGAEAYIEKRFESVDVQVTVLRKLVEDRSSDFQIIFNAMAERIRGVSQRRLKREQEIGAPEANL